MISTSQNPNVITHTALMDSATIDIKLYNIKRPDWVKINAGNVGYYRTLYTPDTLKKFDLPIRTAVLPPLDRLGLLDDVFAMVKAGFCTTMELLKLMESYIDETNYTVRSAMSKYLAHVADIISYTYLQTEYNNYSLNLFRNVATELGWEKEEGESHTTTLLRALVLNKLITAEDSDTITEAKNRFVQHLSSERVLEPDLRVVCYRAILRDADLAAYEEIMKLCEHTDTEERMRILRSLGAVKDDNILVKVLQFSISDTVSMQEAIAVISSVVESRKGRDMVWKFFQYKFDVFLHKFQGGPLFANLIECIIGKFATEEKAVKIETFFNDHPIPGNGANKTIAQCLEKIRINSAWLHRDIYNMNEFLTGEKREPEKKEVNEPGQALSFTNKSKQMIANNDIMNMSSEEVEIPIRKPLPISDIAGISQAITNFFK